MENKKNLLYMVEKKEVSLFYKKTFETPVTPNEIKMNNGILINWLGKSFIEILEVSKLVIKCENEIKLIAVLK